MAISKKLLDDLKRRREEALAGGDANKVEARRAKGLMMARERLQGLFAPDTFQEFGLHSPHAIRYFGMENMVLPADGVVTGTGYVDGRPVAGFSQDFTVASGSLGKVHAAKICEAMDYAGRAGMAVVGFNDSGGARIEEGVESLSGYGQVFDHHVNLSGVVPQIAVVAGPCVGAAAYSPALMDFVIMTRSNSSMFVCGPDIIQAVTGEATTVEEIGGAEAHAAASGTVHLVADDDNHALVLVRRLLSFLPSNNMSEPPHRIPEDLTCASDAGMNALVPESPTDSLDVKQVIARLVDDGDFLELQPAFAANIVTAFARIDGCVVGVVANQSTVKGGTLDMDGSDKGARFIRFCDSFNIPIVSLVDIPGFLPSVEQERGGIARHGAKMLFANAAATVPKITVVMRKAYGGAFLAMGTRDTGTDAVFAWPTADIGLMGAEGAVAILFRPEFQAAEDPAALVADLAEHYRERFPSPYLKDGLGLVTDVIEPARTRAAVALALRGLLSKRQSRLPKKHGNIPL